jgi:hypothetical protein
MSASLSSRAASNIRDGQSNAAGNEGGRMAAEAGESRYFEYQTTDRYLALLYYAPPSSVGQKAGKAAARWQGAQPNSEF